jgi:SAM-dependent methyltransferase
MDRAGGPEYRYVRCEVCGLAVLENGSASSSADYEGSGYYGKARTVGAPVLDAVLRFVDSARLRVVRRLAPDLATGRLLDIGSGKGRFLQCAQARGWGVIGLEPLARGPDTVPTGTAVIREHLRPDLWQSGQFDLITMWHVLEHLPDPVWALRTARHWLRPDGVLAVAVPNRDSWQAMWGQSLWFHLDPPRHIHQFSPAVLERVLKASGFQDVKVVFPLVGLAYLGMMQTILNRLGFTPNLLYNWLKRNREALPPARHRLVGELVGGAVSAAILAIPLAGLTVCESLAGHGGTMIAVGSNRVE